MQAAAAATFVLSVLIAIPFAVIWWHADPSVWPYALASTLLEAIYIAALAYAYRRHAHNATVGHTDSLLRFKEEAALYDHLSRAAAIRRWTRAGRIAARKSIIKLNLLYCAVTDSFRLHPIQAWKKGAFLCKLFCRLFG